MSHKLTELGGMRSDDFLVLLAHAAAGNCGGCCVYKKACERAQDLLDHMTGCTEGPKCELRYCKVAHALVVHWCICANHTTCKYCKKLEVDNRISRSALMIIDMLECKSWTRP